MARLISLMVFLACGVLAQSIDVYGTILSSHLRQLLTESRAETASPAELFAGDILRVSKSGRQPTRVNAVRFSTALLEALAAVEPARLRTDTVAATIVATLYAPQPNSPGSETVFQRELSSLGVSPSSAENLATLLRAMAVEARP